MTNWIIDAAIFCLLLGLWPATLALWWFCGGYFASMVLTGVASLLIWTVFT